MVRFRFRSASKYQTHQRYVRVVVLGVLRSVGYRLVFWVYLETNNTTLARGAPPPFRHLAPQLRGVCVLLAAQVAALSSPALKSELIDAAVKRFITLTLP